jgi:hemerythrin-like domain-containing protein
MLTATYSFVAISAEQDMARSLLYRLQQAVRNIWHSMQKSDFSFLEAAFEKLFQFDRFCRHRKLDLYVIPTLRNVTRDADALLEQLEALRESGLATLRTARERLVAAFDSGNVRTHEAVHAMETFVDNMQTKLAREEAELFPLLRKLLSVEDWFSIAAQFLADDAGSRNRERQPRAVRREASMALGRPTVN